MELVEEASNASSSIELLHCSQQPEEMKPERITEYMADLPAVTQHYDMVTFWEFPLERVEGWINYVSAWEKASLFYTYRL